MGSRVHGRQRCVHAHGLPLPLPNERHLICAAPERSARSRLASADRGGGSRVAIVADSSQAQRKYDGVAWSWSSDLSRTVYQQRLDRGNSRRVTEEFGEGGDHSSPTRHERAWSTPLVHPPSPAGHILRCEPVCLPRQRLGASHGDRMGECLTHACHRSGLIASNGVNGSPPSETNPNGSGIQVMGKIGGVGIFHHQRNV